MIEQPQSPVTSVTAAASQTTSKFTVLTISVPTDAIGLLIGKGGKTLSSICNNCKVQISLQAHHDIPFGNKERAVIIQGLISGIIEALRSLIPIISFRKKSGPKIRDSVEGATEASGNDGEDTQELAKWVIPQSMCGKLIGKGGSSIKQINARSGAWVKIAHEEEGTLYANERIVYIRGTKLQIDIALDILQELVENSGRPYEAEGAIVDGSPTTMSTVSAEGTKVAVQYHTIEFGLPAYAVGSFISAYLASGHTDVAGITLDPRYDLRGHSSFRMQVHSAVSMDACEHAKLCLLRPELLYSAAAYVAPALEGPPGPPPSVTSSVPSSITSSRCVSPHSLGNQSDETSSAGRQSFIVFKLVFPRRFYLNTLTAVVDPASESNIFETLKDHSPFAHLLLLPSIVKHSMSLEVVQCCFVADEECFYSGLQIVIDRVVELQALETEEYLTLPTQSEFDQQGRSSSSNLDRNLNRNRQLTSSSTGTTGGNSAPGHADISTSSSSTSSSSSRLVVYPHPQAQAYWAASARGPPSHRESHWQGQIQMQAPSQAASQGASSLPYTSESHQTVHYPLPTHPRGVLYRQPQSWHPNADLSTQANLNISSYQAAASRQQLIQPETQMHGNSSYPQMMYHHAQQQSSAAAASMQFNGYLSTRQPMINIPNLGSAPMTMTQPQHPMMMYYPSTGPGPAIMPIMMGPGSPQLASPPTSMPSFAGYPQQLQHLLIAQYHQAHHMQAVAQVQYAYPPMQYGRAYPNENRPGGSFSASYATQTSSNPRLATSHPPSSQLDSQAGHYGVSIGSNASGYNHDNNKNRVAAADRFVTVTVAESSDVVTSTAQSVTSTSRDANSRTQTQTQTQTQTTVTTRTQQRRRHTSVPHSQQDEVASPHHADCDSDLLSLPRTAPQTSANANPNAAAGHLVTGGHDAELDLAEKTDTANVLIASVIPVPQQAAADGRRRHRNKSKR